MTSCERATNLFGRAWDDELTAPEREGLESHFAACAPCRRAYDELARTLELVQALPRPQVDDDFARRVLLAAETREREARSARRRVFALPQGWSWPVPSSGRPAFALAATFVVALGVGAFLLARPFPGAGPTIDSPTVATTTRPRAEAPTPSADLAPPTSRPVPEPGEPATMARAERPAPGSTAASTARRRATAPAVSAPEALAAETTPSELDSLFDHSADVELVLDPVQLRRERGRGYTPASPTVKGEAASITF